MGRGSSTAKAMFGLDAFRTKFRDGARGYTFYITPIFPSISTISNDSEDYAYLVRSGSLPSVSLSELATNWQGSTYYVAGTQQFSTWTIDYHLDINAVIYDKYINWLNYIHEPKTGLHGNPELYMIDQPLQLVDGRTAGSEFILAVELYGAFPTAVSDIRMDHGSRDWASFSCTYRFLSLIHI